jgi:hypothetical protein
MLLFVDKQTHGYEQKQAHTRAYNSETDLLLPTLSFLDPFFPKANSRVTAGWYPHLTRHTSNWPSF